MQVDRLALFALLSPQLVLRGIGAYPPQCGQCEKPPLGTATAVSRGGFFLRTRSLSDGRSHCDRPRIPSSDPDAQARAGYSGYLQANRLQYRQTTWLSLAAPRQENPAHPP